MKRTALLFAIALILASNGIALIGVARNRSGEPTATIELTERELPLMNIGMENSGIDLNFTWFRTFPEPAAGPLNRSQLEQIGFDFRFPAGTLGKDIDLMPRKAFVALEYQGPAWKQWLVQVEEERQRTQPGAPRPPGMPILPSEPLLSSRLFAVDAAKSFSELRARYPDQSKHLIVQAVVRARVEEVRDGKAGMLASYNCSGFVAEILPAFVHVPLPHARILALLNPRKAGEESRYFVTLQYGRNLEPWVASVRLR
jgi:hypothetical protein